jgi:hypothetical protein
MLAVDGWQMAVIGDDGRSVSSRVVQCIVWTPWRVLHAPPISVMKEADESYNISDRRVELTGEGI